MNGPILLCAAAFCALLMGVTAAPTASDNVDLVKLFRKALNDIELETKRQAADAAKIAKINKKCAQCTDNQVCLFYFSDFGPRCLNKKGDDPCGGMCTRGKICDANFLGSNALNCHF